MAPRGRKKKAGMMREDAARDAMRNYGFDERVIKESIKQLAKVYEDQDYWSLIEDERYAALFEICLEKQRQQEKEMAKKQQNEMAEEQQEEEETKEQEQHVEDGRDNVGSNTTSLVGCGEGTLACQTDATSIISDAIMDTSPAAFFSGEASTGFAQQSVGGARDSRCGWVTSEEETDPEEDGDGDDDEMIQLTPEPLCEELEELLREVRGRKKRKRVTRWDT